jgi:hypothetical protein
VSAQTVALSLAGGLVGSLIYWLIVKPSAKYLFGRDRQEEDT